MYNVSVAAKLKTSARRVQRSATGPGLKKAVRPPLALRRSTLLYQASDYRLKELFERADVVSEGAVASDGSSYFGTTSIILPLGDNEARTPKELTELVAILAADPHAKTRAVRIAHREASVRARELLERLKTETHFRRRGDSVEATVEVEAQLNASGARVAKAGQ